MGLWGPGGKVGSLALGVTVSLPAGLWGHSGFHPSEHGIPGHCMEKSPRALPPGRSLGEHMALSPSVPNSRTAILGPWQELTRKIPPCSRHGEGGESRDHRAPPLPPGVLQRALGTGASPGCHTAPRPP